MVLQKNLRMASFIIFSSSTVAIAAPVNIDVLMQSSADLAVTNKYNQCVIEQKKKGGLPGLDIMAKLACKTIVGVAPTKLSNIFVASNGFGTQNLIISDVPTSIDNISVKIINNCLDVPYPINEKITVVASESLTINKKSTIQSEKSINVSVGDYSFLDAKWGASISAKQVITNESGSTYVTNNTKTTEEILNLLVPARTMYILKVQAVKYGATLDYFGSVSLDASVDANNNKIQNYSTLVPNNKVSIDGSVVSSFVSSTRSDYVQQSAVNCTSNLQKMSSSTAPSSKQQNAGLVDLNTSYIPYGFNSVTPIQVAKNIGNGLQITTANVVGSIQVRAKSSYPNACRTSFFANDKKHLTTLTPNTWSDWMTLDTFTGTTLPFIYTQDECGGNISAEVKYFE